MIRFQIFDDVPQADVINANINTLLGFPNGSVKYRLNMVHFDGGDSRVACIVEDSLTDACAGMTAEQKLSYYDEPNLVGVEYLADEGWFSIQSE